MRVGRHRRRELRPQPPRMDGRRPDRRDRRAGRRDPLRANQGHPHPRPAPPSPHAWRPSPTSAPPSLPGTTSRSARDTPTASGSGPGLPTRCGRPATTACCRSRTRTTAWASASPSPSGRHPASGAHGAPRPGRHDAVTAPLRPRPVRIGMVVSGFMAREHSAAYRLLPLPLAPRCRRSLWSGSRGHAGCTRSGRGTAGGRPRTTGASSPRSTTSTWSTSSPRTTATACSRSARRSTASTWCARSRWPATPPRRRR